MQPSATAPRAKTAASLSFQASSPLADNLACKNSLELRSCKANVSQRILYNEIKFYDKNPQPKIYRP